MDQQLPHQETDIEDEYERYVAEKKYCEKWNKNSSNAFTYTFKYEKEQFIYCPWCGKELLCGE